MVNYNRMKLMLRSNPVTTHLAGKTVDIYDFPDGRLEVRWKGLPFTIAPSTKLKRVSHAAIIKNKRLGEVLAWIRGSGMGALIIEGNLVVPRRSSQKLAS